MTTEKRCPSDGELLEEVGDHGIVDYDGNWDAQATRYDCPKGHTVFLVDTSAIIDPFDEVFEQIDAHLRWNLREADYKDAYIILPQVAHWDSSTGPVIVRSLEDLRNELAKRAVETFLGELEEMGTTDAPTYEYATAIEDVDEILEEKEFKIRLEALQWMKDRKT